MLRDVQRLMERAYDLLDRGAEIDCDRLLRQARAMQLRAFRLAGGAL